MVTIRARVNQSAEDEAEVVPELTNRSVLRAMALLKEVGNRPNGATTAELSAATGLARPTAFRLLSSLVYAGILLKNDAKFTLGVEVARLGRVADPYRELRPKVQTFVDGLAAQLGEATAVSVVNGTASLELIAEAAGSYMLSTALGYVGRDMPLHASATGKVLLASLTDEQVIALLPPELEPLTPFTITDRGILLQALADIRVKDYATLDNELEEGLFAVAVPVRDGSGHLTAIISVSGLGQRMKVANVHTYIERLREAAEELRTNILGI